MLPGKALRVLIIDDSPPDAELVIAELERGAYHVVWERVQTAEALKTALARASWDVILSDYDMPSFTGPAALHLLQTTGQDLPFMIVSGTVDEETAVAALKAGAHDFFVKHRLARLIPAIERELADTTGRRERKRAEAELQRLSEDIERQRLQVFRATMTTVQDIMNNFLNSVQFVRLESEDRLPPEILTLFDRMIEEATVKLAALADLQTVNEKEMAIGVGIDYPESSR
jgi:DNA-binding NtrC family response regulator